MAVPAFEKFLFPFIYYLKDGDMRLKDLREKIIEHFNLSEEDLKKTTRNGNTTQVNDRIGWARQYFRRALFLEIPQQGTYRLTQRAKDYLSCHDSLTIDDLMAYPEYAEYNKAHKKVKDNPSSAIVSEDLTPTEQLEQAYDSIESDLAAELLNKVLEQSPSFFEHLVVDLLVKMGYGGSFENSAKVTRMSNDEGIDGIIYEDKLGLDKIYIQAKRWANQVGRPTIQQFSGALNGKYATKGVFITTSTFSKEARQFVETLNQKLVLIDGQELAKYMIEYNVGVSTKKVYEVKRIDTDYFEE